MRIRYLLILAALLAAPRAWAQSTPCDTTANCCYEKCGQNRACYCDCLYRSALSLRDKGAYPDALRRLEAVNQLCPNIDTKSAIASIYEAHRTWDVREDGKMALVSMRGEQLTPYVFIEQRPFDRGRYLARHTNGDYCIVDQKGRASEMYNYIIPTNNGWFKVRKGGNRETFVDSNMVQIPGWDWYYEIGEFKEGLAMYSRGEMGQEGVINWQGKIVLPDMLNIDRILNTGLVTAGYSYGDNLGIMNMRGDTIQPFIYSYCSRLRDGVIALIRVDSGGNNDWYMQSMDFLQNNDIQNGKVILLDDEGKRLFQESFDRIPFFEENGMAKAKSSGMWGVIHANGNKLLPFIYDSIGSNELFYSVYRQGSCELFFCTDTIRLIPNIDSFYVANGHLRIMFRQNNKWGLMDTAGNILANPISDREIMFDNIQFEVAQIQVGQKYGAINMDGEIVIDTLYNKLEFWPENLCMTYIYPNNIPDDIDRNMGLIDLPRAVFKPGDVGKVSKPNYVNGSNSKYYIEGNNWCGLISYDKKHLKHFYPTSDTAYRSEEYIVYKMNGKWGARFIKNNASISHLYDCFFFFEDGFAWVRENGKWGMIDTAGKYIVEPVADYPFVFNGPFAILRRNDQCAVVNKKGKYIHPFMKADLETKAGFVYGHPSQKYYRNYLNADGQWIFPDSIHQPEPDRGWLIFFNEKGGYGLMDSTLQVLVTGEYDFPPIFNSDWAVFAEKDTAYRVYLLQKRKFYPGSYKKADFVFHHLMQLDTENESLLINSSGDLVWHEQGKKISDFGNFNDTILYARIGDKYGLFNSKGKMIMPAILDEAPYISWDRVRCVAVNGKYGLLGDNGKWIIHPQLENQVYFSNDDDKYHAVNRFGQTAIINRQGEIVVPFSNRFFGVNIDGNIYLSEAGKYFTVNEKAQLVVKPE